MGGLCHCYTHISSTSPWVFNHQNCDSSSSQQVLGDRKSRRQSNYARPKVNALPELPKLPKPSVRLISRTVTHRLSSRYGYKTKTQKSHSATTKKVVVATAFFCFFKPSPNHQPASEQHPGDLGAMSAWRWSTCQDKSQILPSYNLAVPMFTHVALIYPQVRICIYVCICIYVFIQLM